MDPCAGCCAHPTYDYFVLLLSLGRCPCGVTLPQWLAQHAPDMTDFTAGEVQSMADVLAHEGVLAEALQCRDLLALALRANPGLRHILRADERLGTLMCESPLHIAKFLVDRVCYSPAWLRELRPGPRANPATVEYFSEVYLKDLRRRDPRALHRSAPAREELAPCFHCGESCEESMVIYAGQLPLRLHCCSLPSCLTRLMRAAYRSRNWTDLKLTPDYREVVLERIHQQLG